MKRLAIIAGVIFLIVGIAGFIPALCPNGMLFGIFAVDTMHNIVHLATGAVAIALGLASESAARNFFRVFGIVYALVTVMGFVAGRDGQVMGMAMNMADHFLHLAIAAVSLYLGFFWGTTPTGRGHGPDLRGA